MWLLGGADPRREKQNPAEGLTGCLQEGAGPAGGTVRRWKAGPHGGTRPPGHGVDCGTCGGTDRLPTGPVEGLTGCPQV